MLDIFMSSGGGWAAVYDCGAHLFSLTALPFPAFYGVRYPFQTAGLTGGNFVPLHGYRTATPLHSNDNGLSTRLRHLLLCLVYVHTISGSIPTAYFLQL